MLHQLFADAEVPIDVAGAEKARIEAAVGYFCGVRPGDTAGHYCNPMTGPPTPWRGTVMGWPLADHHPARDGVVRENNTRLRRAPLAQPEGEFVHVQAQGWTLIAAWDRSGDKRYGCTASFAFQAELSPAAALAEAQRRWPAVLARIETHIGRPVTCIPWAENV